MGEEYETAESERQPNPSASHRPCARKSTRKFVLDPVPEDVPHSAGPTKSSGVSTNSRYSGFLVQWRDYDYCETTVSYIGCSMFMISGDSFDQRHDGVR